MNIVDVCSLSLLVEGLADDLEEVTEVLVDFKGHAIGVALKRLVVERLDLGDRCASLDVVLKSRVHSRDGDAGLGSDDLELVDDGIADADRNGRLGEGGSDGLGSGLDGDRAVARSGVGRRLVLGACGDRLAVDGCGEIAGGRAGVEHIDEIVACRGRNLRVELEDRRRAAAVLGERSHEVNLVTCDCGLGIGGYAAKCFVRRPAERIPLAVLDWCAVGVGIVLCRKSDQRVASISERANSKSRRAGKYKVFQCFHNAHLPFSVFTLIFYHQHSEDVNSTWQKR